MIKPIRCVNGIFMRNRKKGSRIKQEESEVKPKPLYSVRYRWWKPLNMEELASNLAEKFQVSPRPNPVAEGRIEIFGRDRGEIRVRADTLSALISPYRAILYQREPARLTERDRELLEIVMEAYPKRHHTPFL